MKKVTKKDERLAPKTIVIVVYGEAGIGKTSLAFTAKDPLLLDFDNGAYRSAYRKDSVQIESWSDISQITKEDVEDYQTVIIDTLGKCLDTIASHLTNTDPKVRNKNGGLTISGWGSLKSVFLEWLKSILALGKDVVILAHSKEGNKSDDMIYRLDFSGSSGNEVIKDADLLAFYHMSGLSRKLEFSPTDAWTGKDPAQLGSQLVPDFSLVDDYLEGVIASTKAKLGDISEESKAISEEIKAHKAEIEKINSLKALNAYTSKLSNPNMRKNIKFPVWQFLKDKAEKIGAQFDPSKKAFIKGA